MEGFYWSRVDTISQLVCVRVCVIIAVCDAMQWGSADSQMSILYDCFAPRPRSLIILRVKEEYVCVVMEVDFSVNVVALDSVLEASKV